MKKKSPETIKPTLFELYGIACFEKDYRLSYFLNKGLNISLEKAKDPIPLHLKNSSCEMPYYYTDETDYEFFMFENNLNGLRLMPKYKNINYWLLTKRNPNAINEFRVEESFNKIDVIMASFRINNEEEIISLAGLFFI